MTDCYGQALRESVKVAWVCVGVGGGSQRLWCMQVKLLEEVACGPIILRYIEDYFEFRDIVLSLSLDRSGRRVKISTI